MGMMTLVRVLTPEKYDEIMGLKQRPPQAAAAKPRVSHEFRGRVTAAGEGRLTVRHGNIEGWMAAMTMAYEVDKPEVLTRIKAGDEIRATVYDGDPKLYNVEVVRQ
jgi:Cu/Ag efflux protein CusF